MKADAKDRTTRVGLIVYMAILVVFLLAGLFPSDRNWGMNWWAYFPVFVPWLLFAFGVVAGLLTVYGQRPGAAEVESGSDEAQVDGRYLLWSAVIVIVSGLLFYLFRVQTHFLGDGYNLLTQLEKDIHIIKFTGWGESWLHIQLKGLLGGDSAESSIASFRIFAIAAGVILSALVMWLVRGLFDNRSERLLFAGCLLTGGYMLMYFGYVEYYAGLVTAIMVYCLTGLLVARERLSRWWVLPVFAVAVFLHVFSLTLVPGLVFLLLSESNAGRKIAGLSRTVKVLAGLVIVIAGGLGFYWFYNDNFFFRLSLLTVFEDRFTLEGYTIFSGLHLLDFANLLLMFVPALPLVVVTVLSRRVRSLLKERDVLFLVLTTVCTLGTAFVLDPNYGMPRDWDLFSFAAPPLAVLLYYILFRHRRSGSVTRRLAGLALLTAILMLGPRVASQIAGDVSVAHFESYIHRNMQVEKDGRLFLKEYYDRIGDLAEKDRQQRLREEGATDNKLVAKGDDVFFTTGDYRKAIAYYRQALSHNPVNSQAYTKMGTCYLRVGQSDSALYFQRIANAMNPYSPFILNNLGLTYFNRREYEGSEKAWKEALLRDSSLVWPRVFLTRQYEITGDSARYDSMLAATGLREGLPPEFVRQLGVYHLRHGDYRQAADVLRAALGMGLDSNAVRQLQSQYPALRVIPE